MTRLLPALLTTLTLLPLAAGAHQKSLSYSHWTFHDDRPAVELRMRAIELTRFPPPGPDASELARRLELRSGGIPCTPVDVAPGNGRTGWTIVRWELDCPDEGAREIRSRLFEGVLDSHVHFARIDDLSGDVREHVLVAARPVWHVDEAVSERPSSLLAYVRLGIEHILGGWDHLAFVAALLLLAGSLREVTVLVTGFTVGHSLTLALAVLGVVRPEPSAVEALIGFSIALVAAENLWILGGRDRVVPAVASLACLSLATLAVTGTGALPTLGWLGVALFTVCHFGLLTTPGRGDGGRGLVALAFGLVHGFGFAGVLTEAGLPPAHRVPALLGFNLGVELGQLAVVVLAWPLLAALATSRPRGHRVLVEGGSAAVLALGVFWLVTRTLAT